MERQDYSSNSWCANVDQAYSYLDYSRPIPTFAMAMALSCIGAMMMKQVADIEWDNLEMAIPAFLTMVLMPFTYSIADGIAWGVIAYVAIQILAGKAQEVNMVMWIIFALM